jgi:hypothetical protein
MNDTLKAVVIELSGGNIRNNHINLSGALGMFPDDCLGGRNESMAAKPIRLSILSEEIDTDIDEEKAIFRERGAIRRFFEAEQLAEGDLVLIERQEGPTYRVSKASKRGFKYHL